MYFDIQKLKNYMPLQFFSALNEDNYYNEIEPDIIRLMKVDTNEAVEPYMYQVAAYIAVYIVSDKFTNLTKETLDKIRYNYEMAFKILSNNQINTPLTIEANFNTVGTIDVYEDL